MKGVTRPDQKRLTHGNLFMGCKIGIVELESNICSSYNNSLMNMINFMKSSVLLGFCII